MVKAYLENLKWAKYFTIFKIEEREECKDAARDITI
jgi:hypothetical protein